MTTSISSVFEMDQVIHQGTATAPNGTTIFNGDGAGVNTLLETGVANGNNAGTAVPRARLGAAPTLGAGVTASFLFAHGANLSQGLTFAAPTIGETTGVLNQNESEFFIFKNKEIGTGIVVPGTVTYITQGTDVTDPKGSCVNASTGEPRLVNGASPTDSVPIDWIVDPNSNVIRRRDASKFTTILDNSTFHDANPPFNDDPGYPAPTLGNNEVNPTDIPIIDPATGNPVLPGEILAIAESDKTDFPTNVGRIWFTAPYEVNLGTDQVVPFNSVGFIQIQKFTVEDPCAPKPQNGPAATVTVERPSSTVVGGQSIYATFLKLNDGGTPAGLNFGVKTDGTIDSSVVWATATNVNEIYRFATDTQLLGGQENFTYQAAAVGATEIVGGHDGIMYFLMPNSDQIGTVPANISQGNPIELLSLPTTDTNGTTIAPSQGLAGILLGQDNRVWFTMARANKMGSVGVNGKEILPSDVYDLGLKTEDLAGTPVPGDVNGVFPPAPPATVVPVTCHPGGLVNNTDSKGNPLIEFILGDWCSTANYKVDRLTSELLGDINTPTNPTATNPRGLVTLGKLLNDHRYAPTGVVLAKQGGNSDIYMLTNNDGTSFRNRANFIFRYASDPAHLGQLKDQHDVSAVFPAGSQMEQVLEDNAGNLWVTCRGLSQIVKLSPSLGASTVITTKFPTEGVALDESGNIWFTEYDQSKFDVTGATANSEVGFVPPGAGAGTVAAAGGVEIALPNNSKPYGIAPGPTGTKTMWVTLQFSNELQKIDTTTNTLTTTVTLKTTNSQPQGIVLNGGAKGDGKLYFTEVEGNNVGFLDPSTNNVTEVSVTTTASRPTGIAIGADNAPWFVETTGENVGRLSLATNKIEETPLISGGDGATFIIAGPADASGNPTMLIPALDLDRLSVLSFKVNQ